MSTVHGPGPTDDEKVDEVVDIEETFVVAIDVGTAGTGFSWEHATTRKGTVKHVRHEGKVKQPTNLYIADWDDIRQRVYDETGENPPCELDQIYLGDHAMSQRLLDEDNEDGAFYFLFKMDLYKENRKRDAKTNELMSHSVYNGHALQTMKVFACAIYKCKEMVLKAIQQNVGVSAPPKVEDIRWVVTVPAIWDDASRNVMERAYRWAGLPKEHTELALEPEAASLACRSIALGDNGTSIQKRQTWIVCDMGGGTADITVHKLCDDGTIAELHRASGGAWGSTFINLRWLGDRRKLAFSSPYNAHDLLVCDEDVENSTQLAIKALLDSCITASGGDPSNRIQDEEKWHNNYIQQLGAQSNSKLDIKTWQPYSGGFSLKEAIVERLSQQKAFQDDPKALRTVSACLDREPGQLARQAVHSVTLAKQNDIGGVEIQMILFAYSVASYEALVVDTPATQVSLKHTSIQFTMTNNQIGLLRNDDLELNIGAARILSGVMPTRTEGILHDLFGCEIMNELTTDDTEYEALLNKVEKGKCMVNPGMVTQGVIFEMPVSFQHILKRKAREQGIQAEKYQATNAKGKVRTKTRLPAFVLANKMIQAYLDKHGNPKYTIECTRSGDLKMSYDFVRDIVFGAVINPCFEHLEMLLQGKDPDNGQMLTQINKSSGRSLADELKTIQYLFLVGGFADSKVLKSEMTKFCNGLKLKFVCPPQARLAILQGAIRFGQNPNAVSERRARLTYGTDIFKDDPSVPEEKQDKVFDKWVEINSAVTKKPRIVGFYTPETADQTEIFSRIYASMLPNPKYITDDGVFKVGDVALPIPGTGIDRRIQVELSFGTTSLTVLSTPMDGDQPRITEQVKTEIDFTLNKSSDPNESDKAVPKGEDLVLSCRGAIDDIMNNEEQELQVVVSVRAPQTDAYNRQPVDLVLAVDTSGSMSGDPMKFTIEALEFVVEQLQNPKDRVGMVEFGGGCRTVFPLTEMSYENKDACIKKIQALRASGGTPLQAAMLEAINMIKAGSQNPSSAIMLLSDGGAAWSSIQQLTGGPPPCVIHALGFGRGHDERLLMSIAEEGNGSYYFIPDTDTVAPVVITTLTGLLTSAGQNMKLEVMCATDCDGNQSKLVSCKPHKPSSATDINVEIDLGDIAGEERRDTVISVRVPSIPRSERQYKILTARLSYMNLITGKQVVIEESISIKRTDPSTYKEPNRNTFVDENYNRCLALEALKGASGKAGGNDLAGAIKMCTDRIDILKNTVSGMGGSVATAMFINDLNTAIAGMSSTGFFNSTGRKNLLKISRSLLKQKCDGVDSRFETKAQRRMKKRWVEGGAASGYQS